MADRRTYTIPLRRSFQKTERHQRAKKAISATRIFLSKHMKSDNVKIGRQLNEHLWARGIRNPPAKVKVVVEKDDDGMVFAELEGVSLPSERKEMAAQSKEESKAAAADKEARQEKAEKKKAEEIEQAKEKSEEMKKSSEKSSKSAKKSSGKKSAKKSSE